MKTTKKYPYVKCVIKVTNGELIELGVVNYWQPFVDDWTCFDVNGDAYFAVLPEFINTNHLKVLGAFKSDLERHIEELKLQQNKIINKIVELKQTHE